MSQTKFTPGPWFVEDDSYPDDLTIKSGKNKFVAKVAQWRGNKEANARLIAAAPEMYELLKGIRDASRQPVLKEMIDKLLNKINQ